MLNFIYVLMTELGEDPDEISPSLQKALLMKRAGTVPVGYFVLASTSSAATAKPLAVVADTDQDRVKRPAVRGTGDPSSRPNRIAALTDPIEPSSTQPAQSAQSAAPTFTPQPHPGDPSGNALLERLLNMPTD